MYTIDARLLHAAAVHEGVVPAPYLDTAGVWTFGVGHTAAAGAPDPVQMQRGMPKGARLDEQLRYAFTVLRNDLRKYVDDVERALGSNLKPHELAGWVLWHYNTGGVFTSSAVKKWLAGDRAGAMRTLKTWNKITVRGRKIVSSALSKRRAEEVSLITRATWPSEQKVVVWPVDARGEVTWTVHSYLTIEDVIEFSGIAQKPNAAKPVGAIAAAVAAIAGALSVLWDKVF